MADSNIIITSSIESLRRSNPEALRPQESLLKSNPEALRPQESSGGEAGGGSSFDLSPLVELSQLMLDEIKSVNMNFELLFEKMEMEKLRARDKGAPSSSPSKNNSMAPNDNGDDESLSLFGAIGITALIVKFKTFVETIKTKFKLFFTRIKVLFLPLTTLFVLIDEGIDQFTSDIDKSFVSKLVETMVRTVRRVAEMLILFPLELLQDASSMIARALGFENAAEYIDRIDFKTPFDALFDKVEEGWGLITSVLLEPIEKLIGILGPAIKDEFLESFSEKWDSFTSMLTTIMNTIFSAVQWFSETDMEEKVEGGLGLFRDVVDGIQKWIGNLASSLYEALPDFAKSSISFAKDASAAVGNLFSDDNTSVTPLTSSTRETSAASLSEESRIAAAQNITGQQASVNVVDNSVSSTSNSSSSAAIMMETPPATDRYDPMRGRNGLRFA